MRKSRKLPAALQDLLQWTPVLKIPDSLPHKRVWIMTLWSFYSCESNTISLPPSRGKSPRRKIAGRSRTGWLLSRKRLSRSCVTYLRMPSFLNDQKELVVFNIIGAPQGPRLLIRHSLKAWHLSTLLAIPSTSTCQHSKIRRRSSARDGEPGTRIWTPP